MSKYSKYFNQLLKEVGITLGEAYRNNTTIVSTKEELDIVLSGNNGILKYDTRNCIHNNLRYKKGIPHTVTMLQSITRSPLTEFHEEFCLQKDEIKKLRNENNNWIKRNKFTKEYMVIKHDGSNSGKNIAYEMIYVLETQDKRLLYFTKFDDNCYQLLNNGRKYKMSLEELAKLFKCTKDNILEYLPLPPTPAGDKENSVTFMLFNNKTIEGLEEYINTLLVGGYKLKIKEIKETYENGTKDNIDDIIRKILKLIVRVSAKLAPSVSVCDINGIAVFDGEFTNVTDEGFYNEKVVKAEKTLQKMACANVMSFDELKRRALNIQRHLLNDENLKYVKGLTGDGISVANIIKISAGIYKTWGILVDPILLLDEDWQQRTISMKCSMVFVRPETFKIMLDNWNKVKPLQILGDSNNIAIFTDKQGMKLPVDSALFKKLGSVKLEVLARSKASKGYFSSQIARILFSNCEDSVSVLDSLTQYGCEYASRIDSERLLPEENTKDFTINEIFNTFTNGYFSGLNAKANPELVFEHIASYKEIITQEINTLFNMGNKIKLPLNVENRTLVPDFSFLITAGKINRTLTPEECFINNPKRNKIIFFKYPIQGTEEYNAFTNAKISNIKTKINNYNNITDDEKEAIINFFKDISSHVIVMPASIHSMHTCAGYDFDYDESADMYDVSTPNDTKDKITNQIVNELFDKFRNRGVHIL